MLLKKLYCTKVVLQMKHDYWWPEWICWTDLVSCVKTNEHAEDTWLIHNTKHCDDIKSQSLKHATEYVDYVTSFVSVYSVIHHYLLHLSAIDKVSFVIYMIINV